MEEKVSKFKEIDWKEEITVDPAEDYYLIRWMYMCSHLSESAILAGVISVVMTIIYCFIYSKIDAGSIFQTIKIFLITIIPMFFIVLPCVIFYRLTFSDGVKTSFIMGITQSIISSVFSFIAAAFTGGFSALGLILIAIRIAIIAVLLPIAGVLLLYMAVYGPLLLLFYAIMYLIDKKINIGEEAGKLLDNIVSVVSIVVVIFVVKTVLHI